MKTTLVMGRTLVALGVAVALGGCGDDANTSFDFLSQTPDKYARVDRTGEPAIAAALLSRDPAIVPLDGNGNPVNPGASNAFNSFNNQRDALNRGDPINDARDFAAMLTVGPQSNALRNIHYEVGPQLRVLGLTPCSTEMAAPPANNTQVDISTCVNQVAPVVLPDVITFDFSAPAGWPNGRGYDDPVVDRLLAAALLKVSGAGAPHNINTLVGVINTTKDETNTPLPSAFPFLRPAHP